MLPSSSASVFRRSVQSCAVTLLVYNTVVFFHSFDVGDSSLAIPMKDKKRSNMWTLEEQRSNRSKHKRIIISAFTYWKKPSALASVFFHYNCVVYSSHLFLSWSQGFEMTWNRDDSTSPPNLMEKYFIVIAFQNSTNEHFLIHHSC